MICDAELLSQVEQWTAETIAGVGKRYPTMDMAEYAGTLPTPRL